MVRPYSPDLRLGGMAPVDLQPFARARWAHTIMARRLTAGKPVLFNRVNHAKMGHYLLTHESTSYAIRITEHHVSNGIESVTTVSDIAKRTNEFGRRASAIPRPTKFRANR
jgi:hypothetical protein